MTLKSDITVDASKFDPSAVSAETREVNKAIQGVIGQYKHWFEIPDISEARKLQYEGKALPFQNAPNPAAQALQIPSRDAGRSISCKVFKPHDQASSSSSIFLHFHGGGWVHGDADILGNYLDHLAKSCNIICVSVDYRLAPENKFPKGHEDCYDVAEWLIDHGERTFNGAKLSFISGESAGGNLTLCTTLHLLKHKDSRYSGYRLRGIVPHYPVVSADFLPAAYHQEHYDPVLILNEHVLTQYIKALCPPDLNLKDPAISPLYSDLRGLQLPPALFTIGTEDALLDDSLFMHVKWAAAGGEGIIKVLPGAAHGYIENPDLEGNGLVRQGIAWTKEFVMSKMAS